MIQGYNQEEVDHLGVAVAITSLSDGCGLGVVIATQTLGRDFIPLFQERYDFVIRKWYADKDLLGPHFELPDGLALRRWSLNRKARMCP